MEGSHKEGIDWKQIGVYGAVTALAVFVSLTAHTFVKPHITAFVHSNMSAKDAALATTPASVLGTAATTAKS